MAVFRVERNTGYTVMSNHMPGTGGIGRYPEKKGRACGWVHLDVRAAKARWTG